MTKGCGCGWSVITRSIEHGVILVDGVTCMSASIAELRLTLESWEKLTCR
jgi:hypothetical protein